MKPFFSLLTTVLNPRTHNFVELAEQVCAIQMCVCVREMLGSARGDNTEGCFGGNDLPIPILMI